MAKGYNQFLQGINGKVGALVVTTNGPQTIMRKRVYRNPSATPAQKQQKANITGLAHLWSALSPSQMASWRALGLQMSDKLGTRALTNYQAFVSVNGVLLACGQPTVLNAPAAPAPPAALPPVLVTAATGQGGLSLTLNSAAYQGLVQVLATAPASPGRNSFNRDAFKPIAVLPALSAGTTPLGADYIARFGLPAPGRKIALLLTPVSPAGFPGASVEPIVVVNAPAAASAPAVSDAADPPALKAA